MRPRLLHLGLAGPRPGPRSHRRRRPWRCCLDVGPGGERLGTGTRELELDATRPARPWPAPRSPPPAAVPAAPRTRSGRARRAASSAGSRAGRAGWRAPASAMRRRLSASSASCSTCGLESTRITESGSTTAPGSSTRRSTRPLVSRRNPADLLGDQRPRAAHLAQHLATLDRTDPYRRALDRRRRRLEARERDGHDDCGERDGAAGDPPPPPLLYLQLRSQDVHSALHRSHTREPYQSARLATSR